MHVKPCHPDDWIIKAYIDMGYKLLIVLISIVFSANSHAAAYKNRSFDEMISHSDYVIVGTVLGVSTFNAKAADLESRAISEMDIDLFSVVTFTDVSLIESSSTVTVPVNFNLYIDGGIIAMPQSMRSRYPKSVLYGQGNTAVPSGAFLKGKRLVLFVSDNKRAEAPFAGRFGVLQVDKSGEIYANGRRVIDIRGGNLVLQKKAAVPVPRIAEGPTPPIESTINPRETDQYGFDIFRMINHIQNTVSAARIIPDVIDNATNPKNPAAHFVVGGLK